MYFFGFEAVNLHTDCESIAVMRDEVVKEHASVHVLSEDLIDSETKVLLAQKVVNFLPKMVNNNVMFLFVLDLVILTCLLFFFEIHVFRLFFY